MKLRAFLLAIVVVVGARAERDIEVKLDWLNHAEMKCESCSTQLITNRAGAWCIIGALCGGDRVFLKILAQWQGEKIEVSLTRQVQGENEKFTDDGQSVSVMVRETEVKELELRGFKYAISARAAPEKGPNQSSEPMPTAGTSAAERPFVPAAAVAHL
jgi:hypothetical protein